MIAARRSLGILIVALAAMAAAACSPPRALEAMRVLADLDAGPGPSSLKQATPTPRRVAVAYRVAGRAHLGDLYRSGDETLAALVLVPGAAEAGKDDARLVAFATTLARARFAVLVPDIASLRALHVRAADARDIADAVAHLSSLGDAAPDGRVGVVAISYAVGPAVIAALEADIRDKLRFVVGIGGYYDIEAVVTFFTTGSYRERPGAPWRYRAPNAYGKWVFVAGNAERVRDPRDRTTLQAMARRKLNDLEAD
ncbi:MAG: RNA methyltransferase, partial [Alphaproteobacteria bacterium]